MNTKNLPTGNTVLTEKHGEGAVDIDADPFAKHQPLLIDINGNTIFSDADENKLLD